jgi:prolyl-tRNA synthetase
LHRAKKIAVNEEVLNDEVLEQLGLKRDELEEVKAAEVGNIFTLKDKFSTPLGLLYSAEDGQRLPVMMGCYGIGPSRLVGVITELLADDKGLVWPAAVAPFQVYLAPVGTENDVREAADTLYADLTQNGIAVLYDDRDTRPGDKFADADLYGIPYRVVISSKTLEQSKLELKRRTETDSQLVEAAELIKRIKS